MKIKKLVSLAVFSSSLFVTTQSFADCYTKGSAGVRGHPEFESTSGAQGAVSEVTSEAVWDDSEALPYLADHFGTEIAGHEGTDVAFHGPVRGGFVVLGSGDINTVGSETAIQASMRLSIQWTPDSREVCTNHKTVPGKGRKCVKKGIETLPTSFVVDIVTDGGSVVHYKKQFNNVNSLQNGIIDFPELRCTGPINNFEVRVRELNGGQVNFTVHEIVFNKFSKF
ncbi:MAG: hypothetical protein H7318_08490 [Oligoflexus sp.]|nr:hypothetical protein [Oligoflexus sp.]